MSSETKVWSVSELIRWSVNYLQEKGITDARSSVEWMLCDILKCSRVDLYMQHERPMNADELASYKVYLKDCAAHRPVQQIIGETEFYGLKFAVSDKVLIPRPETELLVDRAIEICSGAEQGADPMHILDIGAGSGAISIALAMHCPQIRITALEKSRDACDVMLQNLRYYNLSGRVQCLPVDVFKWQPACSYGLIVSNPPYISAGEMERIDRRVSHYEPYAALSDGGDGLTFYRYFAQQFKTWLLPGSGALMEFGGSQQEGPLLELFSEYPRRTVLRDLQDDPRILEVYAQAHINKS